MSRLAKTLTFRKHIFHFAHEFWDFPSWEAHVGRSKIFAVEANPLVNVVYQRPYRHCNLCCEPVKCIWVYLVRVDNHEIRILCIQLNIASYMTAYLTACHWWSGRLVTLVTLVTLVAGLRGTTCFDAWKDVVVPGHTDLWAMQRLKEQSLPAEQRRYRFCSLVDEGKKTKCMERMKKCMQHTFHARM